MGNIGLDISEGEVNRQFASMRKTLHEQTKRIETLETIVFNLHTGQQISGDEKHLILEIVCKQEKSDGP